MNLKGRLVHSIGGEKQITIRQAVITAERIALDWNQDGQAGHLFAKSPNGSHFTGRYGYRNSKSDVECELTLYKGAYEDLLYGTWRDAAAGVEGTLILRLPSGSVETQAPAVSAPALSQPPSESAGVVPLSPGSIAQNPIAHDPIAPGTVLPGSASTPAKPVAAAPAASFSVDPWLAITPEQFAEQGSADLERELLAAPFAALYKLAHQACAADVRAIAARCFAERYGDLPTSNAPPPAPRPTESPEARAQKRRSSRHKQRR